MIETRTILTDPRSNDLLHVVRHGEFVTILVGEGAKQATIDLSPELAAALGKALIG